MEVEDFEDLEYPNVYGSASSHLTKRQISELFEKNRWKTCKCTWVDFEVENEWSELIIEGDDGDCIIHGLVLNPLENIKKIIDVLSSKNIKSKFEIYDNDKNGSKKLKAIKTHS